MSKALYILEYQLNVADFQPFKKGEGFISVTADSYDEACENAVKRLPAEKGKVSEWESLGYGGGHKRDREYRHKFRLQDCLDENHALFVPSKQEINVDNSSASYSSSVAVAHRSLFG